VFTARYGLISYIKQISLRLSKVKLHTKRKEKAPYNHSSNSNMAKKEKNKPKNCHEEESVDSIIKTR
jgi:hypothetical protein